MERVSQEWLSAIDQDALDKSGFGPVKSRDAYVLHLVQAVARECVLMANITVEKCEEQRPLDGTVPLWIGYVVADIRARFGMEDDRG